MKILQLAVYYLLFCSNILVSQNTSSNHYKEVYSLGKQFVTQLRNGDLSQFQNVTPPKDTWTLERLKEYQKVLTNSPNSIEFGEFVEPSLDGNQLGYNLFAFRKTNNGGVEYFFSAIVSFDVQSLQPRIKVAYLFTEKEALKNWWKHVFGFYNTKHNKKVEQSFSYPVCPPPPFKE